MQRTFSGRYPNTYVDLPSPEEDDTPTSTVFPTASNRPKTKRRKLLSSPDTSALTEEDLTRNRSQLQPVLHPNVVWCVSCHAEIDTEERAEFVTSLNTTREWTTTTTNEEVRTLDISILDALEYIYGLSVVDLVKEGLSEKHDDVREDNVILCLLCGANLVDVYHAHRRFNKLSRNEGILRKAIINSRKRFPVKIEPEFEATNTFENNADNNEEEANKEAAEQFKYEINRSSVYSDETADVKPMNLLDPLSFTEENPSSSSTSNQVSPEDFVADSLELEEPETGQSLPAMELENPGTSVVQNDNETRLESFRMKDSCTVTNNLMGQRQNNELFPAILNQAMTINSNNFNTFSRERDLGMNEHPSQVRVQGDADGNIEKFQCTECLQYFKNMGSLRRHHSRFHRPDLAKTYFCSTCGKTTKNITNMRIHQQVHDPNRNPSGRGYRTHKPGPEDSDSFSNEIITGDVSSNE